MPAIQEEADLQNTSQASWTALKFGKTALLQQLQHLRKAERKDSSSKAVGGGLPAQIGRQTQARH
jgi:hypothetical protein